MKINSRKKRKIDIAESGALSDLAFLLIIFFIVIAVFNVNNGFILSLPQKNSTRIVNSEDILKFTLEENGSIYFSDQVISLVFLDEIISENLKVHPNLTVLLKIDPDVRYQMVVSLIEVVRKLEVDNFSFSMTEGEPVQ